MRYGIYYAYWEKQWGVNYVPYVKKVADLGFDVLEISCAGVKNLCAADIEALRQATDDTGIALSAGYGPKPDENIASDCNETKENALLFWSETLPVLKKLGIESVCGGLYSYWPVDYGKPVRKAAELERSIKGVRQIADMAAAYDITLHMEVLNRFEGFLLNTAEEGAAFVRAVDRPNVKLMLDTFHMNIEEDSFLKALLTAGELLGKLHVGEANRKLPGQGSRIPWFEIGEALKHIGFHGDVVMEPFVLEGGQVGSDIKVWRDLSNGATEKELDRQAAASLMFLKHVFGSK